MCMCVCVCVCVYFRGEVSEGRGCSAEPSCGNHSNILLQRPGSSDQLGHSEYSPNTGIVGPSPGFRQAHIYQSTSGIKQSYIEIFRWVKKEGVYVWGKSFPLDSEVNLLKLQTLKNWSRVRKRGEIEGKGSRESIFIFYITLTHHQVIK